jgi:hypothetical protein
MSSSDSLRVPARLTVVLLAQTFFVPLGFAQPDLGAIGAVPERGQSADQARRDRYECHNWAVAQTDAVPARVDPEELEQDRRAERIDKVITGAGIGAAVGGIVGGRDGRHRDTADHALGGAVVGAAIGAILGRNKRSAEDDTAAIEESPYVRALSACLEGRGYRVVIADGET